jgi:hypothetical protein
MRPITVKRIERLSKWLELKAKKEKWLERSTFVHGGVRYMRPQFMRDGNMVAA